jgi:hypothetical protein
MIVARLGAARAALVPLVLAVLATLVPAGDALAAGKGYKQEGPPPTVRIEPPRFDFGTKDPNDLIDVSFKVTNTGSQTLTIPEGDAGIRVSCHCTVPTLEQRRIRPGETITIDATLDLRGSIGQVAKDFWVWFDPYRSHPMRFWIQGKLAYPIESSPDKPQVGSSPRGRITLTARDGVPFKVFKAQGKEPEVVSTNADGEDGRASRWTLIYDVRGSSPPPYMLLFLTDHPEAEVLDVRGWGGGVSKPELEYIKNHRSIFCNRNLANVGLLSKGETAEFGVAISRPETEHNAACTISCPDDRVEVEVISVEPVDGRARDERYTVRLTLKEDVEDIEMFLAPLYFQCGNHPDSPAHTARMWLGGYFGPDGVALGQR